MKVIHTGDLHLGIENYGRQDPLTLINSRVMDFFRSLDYLVLETIKQKADLLLITGDIYHQRDPEMFIQNEFSKRLIRLIDNNIPVVLLIGNHDSLLAIKKVSSLQIFKELRVPNIFVIDEPKVIRIDTKNGPIQIAGIPFLESNTLREYMVNHPVHENQKMDLLETIFSKMIHQLKAELDHEVPSILTAHVTLREAIYQNWRPAMIGNELYLSEKVFKQKEFSYVALGHIHKSQLFLSEKNFPTVAYCGSLDVLDFGEAEFEHGFYSVEINDKEVKPIFVPQPNQRKLVTIRIESENEADIFLNLTEKFANSVHENNIIRVVLVTNESIDEQKIRREFSDSCYFIASIKYERKSYTNTRLKELSSEMSPTDTLKQYLEFTKDPFMQQYKNELISLTEEFLKETEK